MQETVACPRCHRQLLIPDNYQGQEVQCPSCRKLFLAGPQLSMASVRPADRPSHVDEPPGTHAPPADDMGIARGGEGPPPRQPLRCRSRKVRGPIILRKRRRSIAKRLALLTVVAGIAGFVALIL